MKAELLLYDVTTINTEPQEAVIVELTISKAVEVVEGEAVQNAAIEAIEATKEAAISAIEMPMPTETLLQTIPAGLNKIVKLAIAENMRLKSITGITPTAITEVNEVTKIETVKNIGDQFTGGNFIKIAFSDNLPATATIVFEKLSTTKQAQSLMQYTGSVQLAIRGLDCIYDTTYNRLLIMVGSYLCDINLKPIKSLPGTASTFKNIAQTADKLFIITSLGLNILDKLSFNNTYISLTNGNSIAKIGNYIVAHGTGGGLVYILIIDTTTVTPSQLSISGTLTNPSSLYSSAIDRLITLASNAIIYSNLGTNPPVIDGVVTALSTTSKYMALSPNGSKAYITINQNAVFDIVDLTIRVKTQVTISQLGSNVAQFVCAYGNYIYFWLTTNVIVIVDATLLTYVKTIGNVFGAFYGFIDGTDVWCHNNFGGGAGSVSRFNVITETVTNYAVPDNPTHISKDPIGNILVGCNNTNNGLSIITPN